jgi:hypothetical protein
MNRGFMYNKYNGNNYKIGSKGVININKYVQARMRFT